MIKAKVSKLFVVLSLLSGGAAFSMGGPISGDVDVAQLSRLAGEYRVTSGVAKYGQGPRCLETSLLISTGSKVSVTVSNDKCLTFSYPGQVSNATFCLGRSSSRKIDFNYYGPTPSSFKTKFSAVPANELSKGDVVGFYYETWYNGESHMIYKIVKNSQNVMTISHLNPRGLSNSLLFGTCKLKQIK